MPLEGQLLDDAPVQVFPSAGFNDAELLVCLPAAALVFTCSILCSRNDMLGVTSIVGLTAEETEQDRQNTRLGMIFFSLFWTTNLCVALCELSFA